MSSSRTPERLHRAKVKLRREELKVEASRETGRRREACDATQDDVADALGLTRSGVARAESPSEGKVITLADLRLLAEHGHGELAAQLCAWALEPTRAEVVTVPEAKDIGALLRGIAAAQKEHSEAQSASMEALADGEVTAAEAKIGEREHTEAGVQHLSVARWYRRKLEEGGRVVRLGEREGAAA